MEIRKIPQKYCSSTCRKQANNDKANMVRVRQPYGAHEFDELVGNWMRAGSYPVGKLFGSVAAL